MAASFSTHNTASVHISKSVIISLKCNFIFFHSILLLNLCVFVIIYNKLFLMNSNYLAPQVYHKIDNKIHHTKLCAAVLRNFHFDYNS